MSSAAVSLFAGIGGFEIAMAKNNFDCTLSCEVDPVASAVLRARFGQTKIHDDVRSLEHLPRRLELLTAGFPCQDLSSTGPKGGIKGLRSSLVEHVFRLVSQHRPKWVVLENVYFMLHLQRGMAMQYICSQFESLGYSWAYRIFDSSAFGLPQRRRRIYFVASAIADPRVILSGKPHNPLDVFVVQDTEIDSPIGFYWTEGTYATGLARNAVPPLKGGSTIGIPSPPAIVFPDGLVATPDIRDAERLQGFPPDWTVPAERAARKSVRWRLVGNAVSVPVAQWVLRQIRLSSVQYYGRNDVPIDKDQAWPLAAYNIGGGRFTASCGVSSRKPNRQVGLDGFIKYSLKPLSERASLGFLHRAYKGNLRYPKGFLATIQRHAARQGSGERA